MLPDADEGFLNNVVGNISIMRLEEHLAKNNRLVPLKELAECLFLGRSQAFNELIICRVSGHGCARLCRSFRKLDQDTRGKGEHQGVWGWGMTVRGSYIP